MKLKMTMNPTDQLEPTDEPPLGDLESDFDDDDRRELISHYANEKYLSKWEVADDDEAAQEKSDHALHVHVPCNSNHELQEKETDNSKTEGDHLVAILDCDDMSLVSYNSIRDCTPSATPRTVPTVQSHPGQLPQSASQDLKLWQGYGGNIYFDAIRCQSMRINSAKKSGNTRKGDIAKRWKSKSCYPLNRRDEKQAHLACIPSIPRDAPATSIHNLGSLRMKSCREKKCRTASCRHTDTTRPSPGNICKGFSEKLVTETFQKLQENRGNCLSKEPLAVSGGQVRDSVLDPIDKVQQFNMQNGFPALLSHSSFFSHQGAKKGSSVVSGDIDPFTKLPLLGKHGSAKQRTSKVDAGGSADGSKPANEPRPVFIIPFGAFDDPVDGDSDLKRKVLDKKEKTSSKNYGDGTDASLGNIKEISNQSEGLESSLAISSNDNNNNLENVICRDEDDDGNAKHQVTITSSVGHRKPFRQGVPDFHLKREISNLSLSNYLRAVPTRGSKEQKRLASCHQSAVMPKMSYTKRSRALPTFYMVNNSLHHVHHSGFNQRMNGSHIYGGYFPTTGRKESELFYAEISTCQEQNSGNSDSSTQDSSRRTKSSVSNRTSSNSPRLPKHALLRATYVSRNSFTRQSVEQSPSGNETLGNADHNKLLPVTGLQISRFNGIHDR